MTAKDSFERFGAFLFGNTPRLVEFVKTSAELLTLVGLFTFIAQKFPSTEVLVCRFALNLTLVLYVTNKVGVAVGSIIPQRLSPYVVLVILSIFAPIFSWLLNAVWLPNLIAGITNQLAV